MTISYQQAGYTTTPGNCSPPLLYPAVMPDPTEIIRRLDAKGHNPRSYECASISRESTPCVMVEREDWIDRIEALERSIADRLFDKEAWRYRAILDEQYWQIEADFWESCCVTEDEDSQYNYCFLDNIGKLDWLSPYKCISSTMPHASCDEVGKRLFGIIYTQQRAKYWQDRCPLKGGRSLDRADIYPIYYWETEFKFLSQEVPRLQIGGTCTTAVPIKFSVADVATKHPGAVKKHRITKVDAVRRSQRGRTKTSAATIQLTRGIQERYMLRNRRSQAQRNIK